MIREFLSADLTGRNSFGVRQRADRLLEFDDAADLPALFDSVGDGEWFVLSGGNNILFTRDYRGTLVTPAGRRIEVAADDGRTVEVRAEAGVEWDDLVQWAVDRGLWGIENLSLIPGRAGAAPVQNIGAYGAEAKDAIRSVECFHVPTRKTMILSAGHCGFGYRDSVFKRSLRGKVVITAITLALSRNARPSLGYGDLAHEVEALGGPTLRNIREAVCRIRRSKLPDPAVLGNAGSFFKNPVVDRAEAERLRALHPDMPLYPAAEPGRAKLAAGWLIDRAGMKGFADGPAGVHDRQALVLVNRGGATGADIIALARRVQAAVRERFGVEIDTEVNIL